MPPPAEIASAQTATADPDPHIEISRNKEVVELNVLTADIESLVTSGRLTFSE